MPVSALNSQVVYDALKANGIRLLSVPPDPKAFETASPSAAL
jgi:hypothetical protein